MMSNSGQTTVGTVAALWRYPVKSMMGEELNAAELTEAGLYGDRAYAVLDPTEDKVVSAKNPRKWPRLFEFRAAFVEPPQVGQELPPIRVTLPDGTTALSGQSDLATILSESLGRDVILESKAPDSPTLEEYWPDIENLDHRDTVTDEGMPAGTFFDFAAVHLLTTATIDELRKANPSGRFEAKRFRPNIVVVPEVGLEGFVENNWVGRTFSIGREVRLSVTGPCPRCVMTTLPQGDLPRDLGILRTAAQQNNAHVGIYASVVSGGLIRRGDRIRIEA
ncbi:MAG: MOSC domain-containing protein [Pirellulaceae bacterium]